MRYLVLHQTSDGPAATLIPASDAADALNIVDDFPNVKSVDYALLIHDGSPVPDLYNAEGEPVALSDAPEPDEEQEEDGVPHNDPTPEPPADPVTE